MVGMLTFVLKKLLIGGAFGAALVGPDGEVLGQAGGADWDGAAPLIHEAASSWDCLAGGPEAERYGGAIVEGAGGSLLVMPIEDGSVLAVLLGPGANQGRVRYEMKKNIELITSVV
ncbi:putative regulator of Ras-like GTPase activity (Roadblock/LC7/MglB family) [Methanofollis sp. W23]|uniref:roadblock/LC7 domain-containing protein n=1 Tax=Methanofollis sp. W23 TaxID=2817849 RepID=UPI001AE19E7B|nr:hypothetical protein [Methanofollis sp. W23]MBP2145683.1 putative regulator of Ras-like GTPase activity (Roadblock/LC7/MglB family) [Methanofollis sp. W23]